jgi:hypothetical protein
VFTELRDRIVIRKLHRRVPHLQRPVVRIVTVDLVLCGDAL